ncbi:MAG TPA: M23 family metallopeptidase [Bacteroidia bacterium]|nr:M23 family metallopeptidase [Sphingobacteriales bacterium]HPD66048.1 M23 family metallopeptidase [Bacteroidia bacterium]HRS59652.1 M23 family metallopeptidase [Bacteroidia bacterium]HRU68195.1 M23 family metallopeptidase [Bacteroidia bacterium]
MAERQNRSLGEKLKARYRLIIRAEDSLEEKTSFKLTRLNVIMFISTSLVLGFLAVFFIIAYTSLRQYIPGYGDFNTIRKFTELNQKYDSLERALSNQVSYLENIRNIYTGNIEQYSSSAYPRNDSLKVMPKSDPRKKSKEDSILRQQVESEETFSLVAGEEDNSAQKLKNLVLFPPVKGIVTEKFNMAQGHYAIDIATAPNTAIKSVMDGVVVFADWSINTGFTIMIQHKRNMISVYKHNSALLKNVGQVVRAGEVIAVAGDTGELSHGPHLHFELWYDGNPVDPEKYILF